MNKKKRWARSLFYIKNLIRKSQVVRVEKKESNNDSLDDGDAYSNLNNGDTHIFTKKKLGYLYIHLNKKNQLLIRQGGILFNIKAETYITKSINNFNTGIYILASLPLINTVNEKAIPLGFSKKTIIYTINIEGEIYTLNLNKVQYLLNYSINVFRARKLLARGNIQIKDRNLVANKKGLSIFRFNKNIIIIKVPRIYIFLTVT